MATYTQNCSQLYKFTQIFGIFFIAVATLVGEITPASAHDELIASTPANSEALQVAPTKVTLQYSDSVLTIGAVVRVSDSADTTWTTGEPTFNGTTVTAPLAPNMPNGVYKILWRVVSTDGHPISGIVPFTIGEEIAAINSVPPTNETSAPPVVGSSTGIGNILRLIIVGVGGAAVALLAFWAITFWRNHHTKKTPPKNSDTPSV
jgi:methionine-rich copper-binding protein CopC